MIDEIPPDPPGIRVWHVGTGRQLRQFENCMKDAAHGRIVGLQFSPDNKSLAIALNYNPSHPQVPEETVVPLLELASGRPRRRFKGHTAQVAVVAFSPGGKVLATGSEDSTILLWHLNRPMKADPVAGRPAAERLRFHWSNLADQDASRAYDAVLALAAMPEQCVPFLAERMKPVVPVSNEQLAKWIADLDANSFRIREHAFAKLAELYDVAFPALKKKLNGKVSLEARRRIEALVNPLDTMRYSPTLLRRLRTVEVLERIASKEARRLLETLAAGAPEAILTREAKASLIRLGSDY